jgi:HSP20 family molecular chaperone IbpA
MGRMYEDQEPDVDVFEIDGEFVIHAALPGVKPEDIKVDATDDSIQISANYCSFHEDEPGEQKRGEEGKNWRQHRQSRYSRQGSFSFAYSFPQEIRAQDARADFNNGRLELHLPKVETDASTGRVRQIPINSAGQPALTGSAPGQGAAAKSTGNDANKPADLRTETSTQKPAPKQETAARKKAA